MEMACLELTSAVRIHAQDVLSILLPRRSCRVPKKSEKKAQAVEKTPKKPPSGPRMKRLGGPDDSSDADCGPGLPAHPQKGAL